MTNRTTAILMLFSLFAAGATTIATAVVIIGKDASLPPIPPPPPVQGSVNYIRVVKTSDIVEPTSDPVWKVELVVNGSTVDSVDAVIGRSYRQTVNRHISGNQSPLPQGEYQVDSSGIVREKFSNPELGSGFWIPITPLFQTSRSYLGIHQDPSWGKTNGESGTSGCIGLRSPADTVRVVNWVRKYNIRSLIVSS